MNFGENLNRIITEYHLTAKQIADKYIKQTGKSIDQRSIRRYALCESTPREDIQREILNAAISLTPIKNKALYSYDIALFKKQQLNSKENTPDSQTKNNNASLSGSTDSEKSTSFSSFSKTFSDFLRGYGYHPTRLPGSFNEVTPIIAKQMVGDLFTARNASANHYTYLQRNYDNFIHINPFEVEMAKNYQRLSLPDRADIIRWLSSEPMSLQFMAKSSTNLSKYTTCLNMIKESESRPSEWDYGEDDPDAAQLFLDSIDINESNCDEMACIAELSYDLVSFGPSEWQFLMLLQVLEANDRGINYCNTSEYSPNNLVGDKVAMLIFFMNKKLII